MVWNEQIFSTHENMSMFTSIAGGLYFTTDYTEVDRYVPELQSTVSGFIHTVCRRSCCHHCKIGVKLQALNYHFYLSDSVGGHSALVTCIALKNIHSFLILSQSMCYRKHESVVRDTLHQQWDVRLSIQNSGKILTGLASGKRNVQ